MLVGDLAGVHVLQRNDGASGLPGMPAIDVRALNPVAGKGDSGFRGNNPFTG